MAATNFASRKRADAILAAVPAILRTILAPRALTLSAAIVLVPDLRLLVERPPFAGDVENVQLVIVTVLEVFVPDIVLPYVSASIFA